ncbi:glycosyltransferase family 9 protein [Nevskia sp.]|uniref:glycosyltransferase family 9 protein n=1 Tax=Nevskia sp. TaxID=1929292 RepID=UPI003F72A69C
MPLHAPRSILVICMRRLGDVLLCTPLIASLRRAYPQARIDALVFKGTDGVLEGNPDLDHCLTMPAGSRKLPFPWRSYDLAITTQANDRPHLIAFLAGRVRAGIVPGPQTLAERWKRWHCRYRVDNDPVHRHTVEQALKLADALCIARYPDVVPPCGSAALPIRADQGAYAVLHLAPMFRYKAWPTAHWAELASQLRQRRLRVVISGGPAASDRALGDALRALLPPDGDAALVDVIGQLKLGDLANLIRGAALFVGPDTSVTHLAAACGVPVVTLFGPTNPEVWGPWPVGRTGRGETPWQRVAPLQQQGNVRIVQGLKACVPCSLEGCDRHKDSRAACLDELPAARVLAAIDGAGA